MNDKINLVRREITPNDALRLLEKNFRGQRPIRTSVVKQYADDMRNGRWNENIIDPISMTKDGVILNGQHRLQAVVESGIAINQASHIASLARMAYAVEHSNQVSLSSLARGTIAGKETGTRQAVTQFANENLETLSECVNVGVRMRKSIGNGALTGYTLFCYIAMFTGHEESMKTFADDFVKVAPDTKSIVATKSHIQREMLIKNPRAEEIAGILIVGLDNYETGGRKVTMRNQKQIIERYEKEIRKNRHK